ncbi:MAG TPA: hypothetical protein VGX68_01320 [Thermoanaerobaculia bacterium]|nr:hypothetical protein [Thermoanaerobaculia bacterium]
MRTLSLMVTIVALFAFARPAAAGDSTKGHGTFTTGGSAVTRFVFHAMVKANGSISGRARFFDNGSLDLDIEVDCLTVSGNTAIVGGTDAADGTTTYAFKVTDNGGGSPADRITLPQASQTCATFNTLGNFALTSGDIEVDDQP